jgi:myo-inositol 2-dehydrogenase / D-chiro-inositol 1-dehydrogenase
MDGLSYHARVTDGMLRYGIIGTGMMGCEHIRNLALLPGVAVTAIADSDATSRSWGRAAVGRDVAVFDDHRELLRDAAVDAVVVATPNHTHAAVLDAVFATRKHVLVEKPLATDVDDAKRLVDAAAKHPGIVWVGMEYRYMRPVARLVEEVHGGAIGRLWMLAIREHRFPFLRKVGDWNRFNRNTGGTLVEKCCHFFDLMNLIVQQRAVRVYASGGCDVNHRDERYGGDQPDILDNAYAIVEFAEGARALLDLCMFAENASNEMEIAATGDRGRVEAFVPEHRLVLTRRDRNEPTVVRFPTDAGLAQAGAHHGSTFFEHLAFRDAIRTGGKPVVSVEDGARAMAMGAAGERSVRLGRPVDLAELGF